jgi:hypothetical protein
LGADALRSFQTSPEILFAEPYLIASRTNTPSLRSASVELKIEGGKRRAVAMAFGQSRLARNAWEMGHALTRRRLNARKPLFFVEPQSGESDYLVVEDIPNALPLSDVLEMRFRSLPKSQWRTWLNEVTTALAVALRKLHEHGFHQPNLRVDTLLIREQGDAVLWFDSLETIRQVHRVEFAQVIASLATLWRSLPAEIAISKAQALRFLRSFLGRQFFSDWKTVWQGISLLVRRQWAREAA